MEQDDAERVNVGPVPVGGLGLLDGFRLAAAPFRDASEAFGGHVGESSAGIFREVASMRAGGIDGPADGEVEVEQHRVAVGGDQDVRRLDVAMQNASRIGVVQRLGESGDGPTDGLRIGHRREDLPRGTLRGRRGVAFRLDAVDVGEEIGPGAWFRPRFSTFAQQGGQSGSAQESHHDHLKGVAVDHRRGQNLDDVRMAGPSQQQGFLGDPRGDLHHDEAVVEVGLLGEKHLGERAPAQVGDQAIGADLVVDLGQEIHVIQRFTAEPQTI